MVNTDQSFEMLFDGFSKAFHNINCHASNPLSAQTRNLYINALTRTEGEHTIHGYLNNQQGDAWLYLSPPTFRELKLTLQKTLRDNLCDEPRTEPPLTHHPKWANRLLSNLKEILLFHQETTIPYLILFQPAPPTTPRALRSLKIIAKDFKEDIIKYWGSDNPGSLLYYLGATCSWDPEKQGVQLSPCEDVRQYRKNLALQEQIKNEKRYERLAKVGI